jgi:hypothetical protein
MATLRFAGQLCGTLLVTSMAVACGPAGSDESLGTSTDALESGEYVSIATGVGDAPYIGDWEHNWGYVLGYLLPGARKVYAQVVTEDSVYGLIGDSGYGAWDHGHHCGWVSLSGLRGGGGYSPVASICPPPGQRLQPRARAARRDCSVQVASSSSDGVVQPAIVLPTCSDFTVYANYDPVTHTFQRSPTAPSPPGAARPGYDVPQQTADQRLRPASGRAS